MKKILAMTHSPYYSGAEVLLMNLARKLKERGIEMDFLLTSQNCLPAKSNDMLVKHIENMNFRYFILPINVKNKFFSIDSRLKMYTFLKNKEYDIIIFNSSQIAVLFSVLKRFLKSGMIFWSHSYRSMFTMKFISLFVDRIAGVSPVMKKVYNQNKTVTILPGLIDSTMMQSEGALYRETGFSKEDFIVGSIGRIHPEKNLEDIIELANSTDERVKFVYIGRKMFHQGSYESDIHDKIRQNGLEDRVKLIGYKEQVNQYLIDFDLLLHTSKNESIGLAPIEGWMQGKCVLIRKYKYFPFDLFQDSENCMVYENIDEMKKKFERIFLDTGLRNDLARRGRVFFEENFSCATMTDSFMELFDQLS